MIKEFIELWKKFNQIYKEAMKNSSVTDEEEELFLETKSVIARKFQTIVESLTVERATVDRTYDVINKIISLKSLPTFSEETLRRINNDWHQVYISLNRLLGHLEVQANAPVRNEGSSAAKSKASMGAKFVMYLITAIVFSAIVVFLAYILGLLK